MCPLARRGQGRTCGLPGLGQAVHGRTLHAFKSSLAHRFAPFYQLEGHRLARLPVGAPDDDAERAAPQHLVGLHFQGLRAFIRVQ